MGRDWMRQIGFHSRNNGIFSKFEFEIDIVREIWMFYDMRESFIISINQLRIGGETPWNSCCFFFFSLRLSAHLTSVSTTINDSIIIKLRLMQWKNKTFHQHTCGAPEISTFFIVDLIIIIYWMCVILRCDCCLLMRNNYGWMCVSMTRWNLWNEIENKEKFQRLN